MTPLTQLGRRTLTIGVLALALAATGGVAPASASAQNGPQLQVQVLGQPTNFTPGDSSGNAAYDIYVTNVGDQPTDPTQPITITDQLPAGLTMTSAEFYIPILGLNSDVSSLACTPGQAQCSTGPLGAFLPPSWLSIAPLQSLVMVVHVAIDPSLTEGSNLADTVTATGGGAPDASGGTTNPVSSTPASFGVHEFGVQAVNDDGSPFTQAGGHPWALNTQIAFNTDFSTQFDKPYVPQNEHNIEVSLPPGLIGDPQATPQCPLAAFNSRKPNHPLPEVSNCPADSQIGTIVFSYNDDQSGSGALHTMATPLFNLAPPAGTASELGFWDSEGVPIVLTAGVRTGSDYALQTDSVVPALDLTWVSLTVWGVPADPSHDAQRGVACDNEGSSFAGCGSGGPSGASPLPFLSMPTACPGQGISAGLQVDSWEHPGVFTSASASMPAVTGCEGLSGFDPTISVAPDTSQAGAPAGLAVDIGVPQVESPSQPVTPMVKNVTVALPQGMTINPSGADGLGSCSDAQFAVDSPDPATCPDSSKIGTVQLHTPLLANALPGAVYVGAPQCGPCSPTDAANGLMVRLFIQVDDPLSGVIVKLPGTVSINQSTGQLTSTFLQNPQLPFDDLQLNLKGGPRAPLVNPDSCGSYTTTSDFTPWSSPFTLDANPSSTFDVTSDCSIGSSFAPSFVAGTQNPQAGSYSPFVLSFSRSDQDQQFKGLSVTLPPGLVAKTAGVPLCSDSDAADGTCPADSQVGTVETGAGAGSEPLFLPGKAYLTGPYKGAPYGLAVVVPAIAGPYNLGDVVVRQALNIDPTTAQVTAVSDPFPTQLDGIPLRIRRVDVNLNRPDFIINPTSCDPMRITGTFTSVGGMRAAVGNRFQVGGCASLGFSPRLSMKLTGKGRTRSGDHPNLVSVLTQRGGQANIHNVRVALPLSMALDPNNSQHVCSYQVAQAVTTGPANCPASTMVGHATAITPLLSQPLSGPVYLVQGIRMQNGVQVHTLPSLLIPLRGQIALDLRAQTSVSHGKLVTTFPTIPDAPVSKFTLTINGGRKGILVITGRGRSICGSPQVTQANLIAQNGKAEYPNIKMGTPCRAVHHKKKHKKHTHRKHSVRRHRG